jgi:flagellar basal body rod protein FlgG
LSGRDGAIHIAENGEIYAGDDLVAPISLVEFGDLKTIRKTGSLYFENKNNIGNPPQVAVSTAIKQGMLETSNVNPVEEISNLIRANRMFEQDLKAMKTVNEMLQREVNDVGKL